jgi:hypothetical protein
MKLDRITRSTWITRSQIALLALGACALASTAHADEPKPVKVASRDEAADDHAEMEKLIGQVEVRLREIDRLLSDAGANDTSALSKVGPSGLAELLLKSRDNTQGVVHDIDRILELADHVHPGGGT